MKSDFSEWIIIVALLMTLIGTALSLVIWSLRNGISPMPTSFKVKKGILNLVPSEVKGTIYELGSGWGTLIFPLARKLLRNQVIGYETSPFPFWVSFLYLKMMNYTNVTLKRENFFSKDLSDAGLVVCYLYPGAMEKLRVKFESDLRFGTIVVSNAFAVPGWVPEKIVVVDDLYNTKIYLYRFEGKGS